VPGNIKALLRAAGTDYVSGDLAGIGIGYAGIGFRYDTDPATGLQWTDTEWNAPIEMGFVSAT
jgi:hypothetical protein